MPSFEEYASYRRSLQEFCTLHVPSVLKLLAGYNFKLSPIDDTVLDDGNAHHLTTTATCWDSIFDCPPRFRSAEQFEPLRALLRQFAEGAIKRPPGEWLSEESATIYCRCRALPVVVSSLNLYDASIKVHLEDIMFQLREDPERSAIGEAAPPGPGQPTKQDWYPPNAFHTYWTLQLLEKLHNQFRRQYLQLATALNLERKKHEMILWASYRLGYQISLHSNNSSVLDTDQLGWSLAIYLQFEKDFHFNLARQDFIKEALKRLFQTQTEVGTWPHYAPLFHYKRAGNAYCYVFETFAVLLKAALQNRPEAEFVRQALKPYCEHLVKLWRYARSTQIPLLEEKAIGWCSGHRMNYPYPESWATASVFAYAQALRRLIGIWAREEASKGLHTLQPKLAAPSARTELEDRGQTWGAEGASVADRLFTLFINPVAMAAQTVRLEPDDLPIAEEQARSAILFGPPGTSKTTLARDIADAISWDYVEIHAGHFVAEGLPNVQRRADSIFQRLMELDHAVVLFDEIDELVRGRDVENDSFGRFLTTSMLPKLAELWRARKILYFVATNHIENFDPAIIRGERFDARVFVGPPSFQKKVKKITDVLGTRYNLLDVTFEVSEAQVQQALRKAASGRSNDKRELRPGESLAKLALLRWEELDELAHRLAAALKGKSTRRVPAALLADALTRTGDSRWQMGEHYVEFLEASKAESKDFSKLTAWTVSGLPQGFANPDIRTTATGTWYVGRAGSIREIEIPGYRVEGSGSGRITVRPLKRPSRRPTRK